MTVAPEHAIESPSDEELAEFYDEVDRQESMRRARDLVLEGTCFYCGRQTLRMMHTGGRYALTCPCEFRG